MQFGAFTWPNDPETVRMKLARKLVMEAGGNNTWTIASAARMGRTFECEGVFCGSSAYQSVNALAALHIAGNPAQLVHPKWGGVNALLTEMEVTEGPGENLLRYRLTFTEVL